MCAISRTGRAGRLILCVSSFVGRWLVARVRGRFETRQGKKKASLLWRDAVDVDTRILKLQRS